MNAVTITMPEQLDAEAAVEARRLGISKSELIRRGLAAVLPDERSNASGEVIDDPWREMIGFAEADVSVEPGEIDDIIYGL